MVFRAHLHGLCEQGMNTPFIQSLCTHSSWGDVNCAQHAHVRRGDKHSCVADNACPSAADGEAYFCGSNECKQLACKAPDIIVKPQRSNALDVLPVSDVSCGSTFTAALVRGNQQPYCWGAGELGGVAPVTAQV